MALTVEDLRERERLVFAFPVGIQEKFFDQEQKRWAILPKYEYLPPGVKPIKFVEQILDRYSPGLLNLTYPRIYERAETYHSMKEIGVMLGLSLFLPKALGMSGTPTTYRLMAPGLKPLLDREISPMFISPTLLEAVRASDFHDEIAWGEIPLPYEEGVLVLPRGAISHPIDGDAGFIYYARQRAGRHKLAYPCADGQTEAIQEGDRFVFTVGFPGSPNLVWYDSNITAEVRPTIKYGELFHNADGVFCERKADLFVQDWPLDEGDGPFLELMGRILFGTLFAITARPDLIGGSHHIRTIPAKREKPERSFWSPNVLGEHYRVRTQESKGGTHASPRWHWRRGHHRLQPYGPGRTLRRQIWIEPVRITPGL